MSADTKEHNMPEQDRLGRLSRRAFIQAGLLGAGAAALLPVSVPVAKPRDVPRNRTLTLVWTGREGRWIDHELWNPYAIGSNHQIQGACPAFLLLYDLQVRYRSLHRPAAHLSGAGLDHVQAF